MIFFIKKVARVGWKLYKRQQRKIRKLERKIKLLEQVIDDGR